jgi:hypothetical protein
MQSQGILYCVDILDAGETIGCTYFATEEDAGDFIRRFYNKQNSKKKKRDDNTPKYTCYKKTKYIPNLVINYKPSDYESKENKKKKV